MFRSCFEKGPEAWSGNEWIWESLGIVEKYWRIGCLVILRTSRIDAGRRRRHRGHSYAGTGSLIHSVSLRCSSGSSSATPINRAGPLRVAPPFQVIDGTGRPRGEQGRSDQLFSFLA